MTVIMSTAESTEIGTTIHIVTGYETWRANIKRDCELSIAGVRMRIKMARPTRMMVGFIGSLRETIERQNKTYADGNGKPAGT
jgi:hypothetical protein